MPHARWPSFACGNDGSCARYCADSVPRTFADTLPFMTNTLVRFICNGVTQPIGSSQEKLAAIEMESRLDSEEDSTATLYLRDRSFFNWS